MKTIVHLHHAAPHLPASLQPFEAVFDDTPHGKPVIASVLIPHGTAPPPARPGVRHVSIIRFGILIADDPLRERVDRWFERPMIILALLTLPLLAAEFFLLSKDGALNVRPLRIAVAIGLAVIWFAFLVEFIIKIAIAESRFQYARRNWLDIVIICAPMLRPLRIAKVGRTARIFTLRGLGVRVLRSAIALVLGMQVAERLAERFGWVRDGRPDPATMTRHDLMREVRDLRTRIDAWEKWHRERSVYEANRGSGIRAARPFGMRIPSSGVRPELHSRDETGPRATESDPG